MRLIGRDSTFVSTALVALIFCVGLSAGCFPAGSGSSDGGTTVGYAAPTLEVTISGVHFGPTTPDPGAYADLTVTRDATGNANGGSFRMSASIGTAGCTLAFDRYGAGETLGVGQYTVAAEQGSSTLDGQVYPTVGPQIATPEGPASCTGSDCDGAAFVLSEASADHIAGYFQGTVTASSGAGQADVICTFWIKTRTYMP